MDSQSLDWGVASREWLLLILRSILRGIWISLPGGLASKLPRLFRLPLSWASARRLCWTARGRCVVIHRHHLARSTDSCLPQGGSSSSWSFGG